MRGEGVGERRKPTPKSCGKNLQVNHIRIQMYPYVLVPSFINTSWIHSETLPTGVNDSPVDMFPA